MRAVAATMGSVLIIMSAMGSSADAPEYQPVPAQLVQQRDGMGNVLAKLDAGEEVRVAYFGGSITAAGGWRVKTLEWFQQTWPDVDVSEIHAAIGGTGSSLGVFRLQQDVLDHDPDLVFVEYAVNDGGASPENIWLAMEGIVRQIWTADPTIDICFVYTFRVGYEKDLNEGVCPRAASADEMLAEYYGIPSINVALRTVEIANAGELIYRPEKDDDGNSLPTPEGVMLFSKDGVHPFDVGHEIYTQVIADAITGMREGASAGAHELKEDFMEGNWEEATIVPLAPWMLSDGWTQVGHDEGLGQRFARQMPNMWEATEPGETISFSFRGTVAKLYDLLGPDGANAVITLDGSEPTIQPRFDHYCSYHRIANLTIATGLEDTDEHTVTVEISAEQPDRTSVLDRVKDDANFNPATYDGTGMRVAGVMIIGEIIEP